MNALLDMHDFRVDHPCAIQLEDGKGQLETELRRVYFSLVQHEADCEDQDYGGDAEPNNLE